MRCPKIADFEMGGTPKIGNFPPKWMVKMLGKPYFLMDDLGVPKFLETPKWSYNGLINGPRSPSYPLNSHPLLCPNSHFSLQCFKPAFDFAKYALPESIRNVHSKYALED